MTSRSHPPAPGSIADKACVITGATSGIGRATALALAAAGARVVAVGRDRERGERLLAELEACSPQAGSMLLLSDLSSQRQVRELAAALHTRLDRLDVPVNNAGVDVGEREVTEDGVELTFAVNHLAPFLLTCLTLDRLEATGSARIVNVSSGAHHQGAVDFEDLQGERRFAGQRAYNQSKLANLLFTFELARRVDPRKITVNCVDPGWVKGTSLGRSASTGLKLLALAMWPVMVTPEQGADTIVWAATSPQLAGETGGYFKKRAPSEPSRLARDAMLARRLWQESEQLTGLDLDLVSRFASPE